MGCLGERNFIEGKELLANQNTSSLYLEPEEITQTKGCEARSFMQCDVDGGQNIHLWFDHWHLAGVL
jgi:hypothetical protein